MFEYYFQHDCFMNDKTYLQIILWGKSLYNIFCNVSQYMKGFSKLIRKFIGNI